MNRWYILLGLAAAIGGSIYWQWAASRPPTRRFVERSEERPPLVANVSQPRLQSSTLRYYDPTSGQLVSLNLENQQRQSSAALALPPGSLLKPSPGGSKLLVLPHLSTFGWQMIDAVSGAVIQLHQAILVPAWSASGDRIVYLFRRDAAEEATLVTANPDGTNYQPITNVPRYEQLWWSPNDTQVVGLNSLSDPPRYELVSLSSKLVSPLADGYGGLRWSPDGKRVLLDRSAGVVAVATVESSQLTEIETAASVDRLVWESESTLLGVTDTQLVRLDLRDRTQRVLGTVPQQPDEVLGVYENDVIFSASGSVYRLTLN